MGRWSVMGLAVATALSCARNPATGERQLNLVPKSQEIAIGQEAAKEVAQSVGLVQDQELQRYVGNLGKALAAKSERPDLPWSFQVVDDAAVNAFALPGGPIFVTRGLLAHLNNEAQLASVVGHEIGHVTGKHAVDRISKAQLAQLGLGVGMLLSDEISRFGQVGLVGLSVLFLKFGRDDEYEADELGVRYAHRAGFDVREMPGVFTTLKRVSESSAGSEGRLPEWLSTHPHPENRIERAQEHIAQLEPLSRAEVDVEGYLKRIDGLVFGQDPRDGYFRGDAFLHPRMRFALTLPSGWRKANLAQAVVAVSPNQDAALQVTITGAPSPEQALRAFASQQGVSVSPSTARVPNLPSAVARFVAQTEQGPVGGTVAFVAHGGQTFQILGLTAAQALPGFEQAFLASQTSFQPLTDAAALNVKPATVEIVNAPRAMTLANLYSERRAPVSLEEIALVNQMEPATTLSPGQPVKWVREGLGPQSDSDRPARRAHKLAAK